MRPWLGTRVLDRRSFALLIRLRQEARKRIDVVAGHPTWIPSRALSRLFEGRRSVKSLAEMPLARHVAGLEVRSLPGTERMQAEAELARSGRWRVFGHECALSGDGFSWRTHPVSGQPTPLHPWHRLRYMAGECGGDVKYLWELNRHKALLRLAQSWFVRRDEATSALLGTLLDGWMDENPPGLGINWASSLEVGLRGVAWCWIGALTAQAPLWTEERQKRFLWQVWHHGRHLTRFDSVHHSPNTHLTGEALALLYLGSCFPQFRVAAQWRRFGLAILLEELEYQILPDGMHFERSTGYHRYTVEFLLHAIAIARATGTAPVPPQLEEAARATSAVLAALRRPDGAVPILGDEDGGSALPLSSAPARDVSPLLSLAATLLDRPDWQPEGDLASRDLSWWLLRGIGQREDSSQPPAAPTSVSFPDGGYFAAWESSSPEPWFCLMDGGPHGGDVTGHAHDDCASVEIARGSLVLVADPGSATYTGDRVRRERDRSATSHGTLVPEARTLAVTSGPFGWSRLPPSPTTQTVDTDAYWACRTSRRFGEAAGDPVHERQALLVRGSGVYVCDWLLALDNEPIRITWPMICTGESLQLEAMRLRVDGRVDIRWHCMNLEVPVASIESHQYAPSYGESETGAALILRGNARQGAVIVTSFADSSALEPRYSFSGSSLQVALPTAVFSLAPGRLPALIPPSPPKS